MFNTERPVNLVAFRRRRVPKHMRLRVSMFFPNSGAPFSTFVKTMRVQLLKPPSPPPQYCKFCALFNKHYFLFRIENCMIFETLFFLKRQLFAKDKEFRMCQANLLLNIFQPILRFISLYGKSFGHVLFKHIFIKY